VEYAIKQKEAPNPLSPSAPSPKMAVPATALESFRYNLELESGFTFNILKRAANSRQKSLLRIVALLGLGLSTAVDSDGIRTGISCPWLFRILLGIVLSELIAHIFILMRVVFMPSYTSRLYFQSHN
jgi:hypothetical protein